MFGLITKPFSWIYRKLNRRRHDHLEVPNGDAKGLVAESWGRTAIVLAPEYDEATKIIAGWIDDIAMPEGVKRRPAIGKSVTKDICDQILSETRGTARVMIFGGHGSTEALLGPLYEGCDYVIVDGNEFAILYDENSVGNGPEALFAFCCKSARRLGGSFALTRERSFMGYQSNIGYDLENEECQKVWKSIIHLISEEIIRDGHIGEKHETRLIGLYDDAMDYFRNGPGKGNDRDLETILCLIKHKENLRRIGGHA